MEFICLYILTFAAIIYVVKTLKPIFFKKKNNDELRMYIVKTRFATSNIEPKMPMTVVKKAKNSKIAKNTKKQKSDKKTTKKGK